MSAKDYVSYMVVCSKGAPKGTVLAPFLFTLYTAEFRHKSTNCHLQTFSDDSAISGLITNENNREYRELTQDFVDWCLRTHLQINAGKTKELVMDFRRCICSLLTLVNIRGMDIEIVDSYNLGVRVQSSVHLSNKLDWSINTTALYRKGQSRLSAEETQVLWSAGSTHGDLFESVVESAIFHGAVCWNSSITVAERKRLRRLIKKTSSVLESSLDST